VKLNKKPSRKDFDRLQNYRPDLQRLQATVDTKAARDTIAKCFFWNSLTTALDYLEIAHDPFVFYLQWCVKYDCYYESGLVLPSTKINVETANHLNNFLEQIIELHLDKSEATDDLELDLFKFTIDPQNQTVLQETISFNLWSDPTASMPIGLVVTIPGVGTDKFVAYLDLIKYAPLTQVTWQEIAKAAVSKIYTEASCTPFYYEDLCTSSYILPQLDISVDLVQPQSGTLLAQRFTEISHCPNVTSIL